MPDRYSNADIMDKLMAISFHQEVMKTDLGVIKDQVSKTNGRVNTLEEWKNGLQAVEQYKKENPTAPTQSIRANTVIQGGWTKNEKLVGAVVALILALASAVQFFVGGIRQ